MFQEESIYNLLPREKLISEKERMYRSMYPHNLAPTGSTFILKNTSYPGVANMGGSVHFPKGAHPVIKGQTATMGRPIGGYRQDPENFIKKNHQYKIIPAPERIKSAMEIRKPSVPTRKDKPVMGLKTEKNYVTANAMEAILMQPKHKKSANQTDLDFYLNKKSYGKTPNCIDKIRKNCNKEYEAYQDMQNRNEAHEQSKKKVLDQSEVELLRTGLQKKLEALRSEYGKLAHRRTFDTIVMREK